MYGAFCLPFWGLNFIPFSCKMTYDNVRYGKLYPIADRDQLAIMGALGITGETMDEYYTLHQVMELLGLRSTNAFRQLERKYPDAFVNVNSTKHRNKNPWY